MCVIHIERIVTTFLVILREFGSTSEEVLKGAEDTSNSSVGRTRRQLLEPFRTLGVLPLGVALAQTDPCWALALSFFIRLVESLVLIQSPVMNKPSSTDNTG